jgi:hypothetical protein
MNTFKNYFLLFSLTSFLFSYSNTCGSPIILEFTHNTSDSPYSLMRSNAPGSVTTFYVRNLSTNYLEEIQFQLLATDQETHFYGEVSEISNYNIDINLIDSLFDTFTSNTPDADSLALQNGIKAAEEGILGPPPIIDGSREIYVLFMDIRDSYSNSGEFVAGFFDPQDQKMCIHEDGLSWQPDATELTCNYPYDWYSNGNGLNIVYIDSNPAKIDENGVENTLFTLAHEYQHLLHWNSDLREGYFGSAQSGWTFHNPWLNEGLSDLMPSILGLGVREFSPYLENSIIGLDEWSDIGSRSTLPYYAKSALFFQYLYEAEGLSIISNIFTNTSQGLASIKSNYTEDGFESLYINWIKSIVSGELNETIIDTDPYANNIENQISMGIGNARIEIDDYLAKYSFTLIEIPDYLSIKSIDFNKWLNVLIYNVDGFSLSYDLTEQDPVINKIILYSNDIEIENISFDIIYDYRFSPNKENLFVYPNPITENTLSYKYFGDGNTSTLLIKLFNLRGKQIFSIEASLDNDSNSEGDLALNLSSGTYIIQSIKNSEETDSKIINIIK